MMQCLRYSSEYDAMIKYRSEYDAVFKVKH